MSTVTGLKTRGTGNRRGCTHLTLLMFTVSVPTTQRPQYRHTTVETWVCMWGVRSHLGYLVYVCPRELLWLWNVKVSPRTAGRCRGMALVTCRYTFTPRPRTHYTSGPAPQPLSSRSFNVDRGGPCLVLFGDKVTLSEGFTVNLCGQVAVCLMK